MLSLFLRGLILGFSIAAPVGPIGILCVRRTLAQGRRVGLVSGMGAATADAIYGSIAAFGLTAISSLLVDNALWLRLIGGLFLCYLGIRIFLTPPAVEAIDAARGGLAGAFGSTLFLTLTNPMTILSFAAIFAGLGLSDSQSGLMGAAIVVAGVFVGSALWWLALSGGVSLFRGRVTPGGLRWINRISGIVVVLFGLIALAGLIR